MEGRAAGAFGAKTVLLQEAPLSAITDPAQGTLEAHGTHVGTAVAHVDPTYAARREPVFVVAINCGQAGGTCFCVSMHTGPRASSGFDLALTEVIEADQHYFLTEVGSPRGAALLRDVPHREAQPEHLATAERIIARTASQMGRSLDTTDIKELLYRNLEHPRWHEVASH